ncbi:hypothetical protein JYT61_00505 [bacterium AH-315-E10]|nr:hypothetical protein [bacterium AH-315-E10]
MKTNSRGGIFTDSAALKRWQKIEVMHYLEHDFVLTHIDAKRRVDLFFTKGFLPNYFFYTHSNSDIAKHLIILTQYMDANRESVAIESDNGLNITYFFNVGTDLPGQLLDLLKSNLHFRLVGMDSISAKSGYRIVSLQQATPRIDILDDSTETHAQRLWEALLDDGNVHAKNFLESLPPNYIREEVYSHVSPPRIIRHIELYSRAVEEKTIIVTTSEVSNEDNDERYDLGEQIRFNIVHFQPSKMFLIKVLEIFNSYNKNISRTYYDLFKHPKLDQDVAIIAIYLKDKADVDNITKDILKLDDAQEESDTHDDIKKEMTDVVLLLSDDQTSDTDFDLTFKRMKVLCAQNTDVEDPTEYHNFYLNCLTEFFEALKHLGIEDDLPILKSLLSFEKAEEFFIESRNNGKQTQQSAYRLRHSSIRGPAKGGLRIHPIADLTEVAALSFMMTWKSAKSKILFGGGKGGVMLNPRDYKQKLEYANTITNFGKALFLSTGPFLDVPAGDVNCGGYEIGLIFEGFKTALRDIVCQAYASRYGAARIAKRIITITEAREILESNFEIDPYDDRVLHTLLTDETYLSLVLASQITGKPVLGIQARKNATGFGVACSIFATIGHLYLEKKWVCDSTLIDTDQKLLKKISRLNEKRLAGNAAKSYISDDDWERLSEHIYPALLSDKRVIVQGAGKVGSSLLRELNKCGANIIAVADAGGAVIGDHLDVGEILKCASGHGSVINAEIGVTEIIKGAAEGAAVLNMPCDILCPCALENAITISNAADINTQLIVCGANGPISAKAATILQEKEIIVVYDFLANSGGVIASYFEWLRALAERHRYESMYINQNPFSVTNLKHHVMPEFEDRILTILREPENDHSTAAWRSILRDIIFAGINDDFKYALTHNISLKTAGFSKAIMQVLASILANPDYNDLGIEMDHLPVSLQEAIRKIQSQTEFG